MRRLAVIAFVLAGCITPSIPIPPPDPTEMTFTSSTVGGQTLWTFSYPPTAAYANGVVTVFDRNNGDGVIRAVDASGSVGTTLAFPAQLGDNVVVTIESGTQTASTCVVLRDGQQDPTVYCQ